VLGVRDPVVDCWFLLWGLAASLLLTPITVPNMPRLDESDNLLLAPNVIRGIPSWSFQIIPVTVFLMYAICSIPNNLLPNANEVLTEVDGSIGHNPGHQGKNIQKISCSNAYSDTILQRMGQLQLHQRQPRH
jgi:hypothetical protein